MRFVRELKTTTAGARSALLEVSSGEAANVDAMAALIVGDRTPHYGIRAALVSVGREPPIPPSLPGQSGSPGLLYQFGFPPIREGQTFSRYYEVVVTVKASS